MRLVSAALAVFLAASAVGSLSFAAPRPESNAEALAETSEKKKRVTDAQIKKILIKQSIDAYEGSCPCPYSRARNGSKCGRRSAHSREGGAAPLCFLNDVTTDMVQRYRDQHGED